MQASVLSVSFTALIMFFHGVCIYSMKQGYPCFAFFAVILFYCFSALARSMNMAMLSLRTPI